MIALAATALEFSEAYVEGDEVFRNAGEDALVFVAVYAEPDVVTRYEQVVEPDGSRERHTVG